MSCSSAALMWGMSFVSRVTVAAACNPGSFCGVTWSRSSLASNPSGNARVKASNHARLRNETTKRGSGDDMRWRLLIMMREGLCGEQLYACKFELGRATLAAFHCDFEKLSNIRLLTSAEKVAIL